MTVDREKKILCAKTLAKLFDEGKVEFAWWRDGGRFRSTVSLEEELSRLDVGVSEEDFVRFTFKTLATAQAVSIGDDGILNEDPELSDIIQEYFLRGNQDLMDYINVHSTSNATVLDDFDYEILTKRGKSNPKKVLTHTALVNFYTLELGKEDITVERVSIELTRKEIEQVIEQCRTILNQLSELEQIHSEE